MTTSSPSRRPQHALAVDLDPDPLHDAPRGIRALTGVIRAVTLGISARQGSREDRPARTRRGRARVSTQAGALGERKLSTIHAVGQALAIGPMFSFALIEGGISRPQFGAGWNATLAVLVASLGVLAIGYVIALFARQYAGAGAMYEYLTRGAHPSVGIFASGIYFIGTLFLGGGGIFLGLGILMNGVLDRAHLGDRRARLVDLRADRIGVRAGAQLPRGADRDPRDADVRGLALIPMVSLGLVIIAKGGHGGNTLTMFDPGQTSLFGFANGGVFGGVLLGILLFVGFEAAASIAEESHDPRRSIPRAVLWTVGAAARVLHLHGLRVLDRLRQGRRREGRLGARPVGRGHDGDALRRLVARDDPRPRRDPRRDRARARDLRHDRPRLLRARPRRAAAARVRAGRRASTRRGSAT